MENKSKTEQELLEERIVLVATDIIKSMSIWEFILLKLGRGKQNAR